MTIAELLEYLEDYRDELGGDAEVRLITQQNWPMENTICGLAAQAEMDEQIEDDAEVTDETEDDAEPVLYIVEGQQLGYGSRREEWPVSSSRDELLEGECPVGEESMARSRQVCSSSTKIAGSLRPDPRPLE